MAVSVTEFGILIALGFSLAAPLGPVNAEIIRKSTEKKSGWVFGLLTGFGAMTGDFVIAISILYLGTEFFLTYLENDIFKISLLSLNIFILGLIGIKGLKSARQTNIYESAIEGDTEKSPENDFVMSKISKQYGLGFIIVTTSPWSYLWWASFGTVILESDIPLESNSDRLLVTVIFLIGIGLWITLITSLLRLSHLLAEEKYISYIQQGAAILILIFALYLVVDIIRIII